MLNGFQSHAALHDADATLQTLRMKRALKLMLKWWKANCNQPWHFTQIAIDLFKWTNFRIALLSFLKHSPKNWPSICSESEDNDRGYIKMMIRTLLFYSGFDVWCATTIAQFQVDEGHKLCGLWPNKRTEKNELLYVIWYETKSSSEEWPIKQSPEWMGTHLDKTMKQHTTQCCTYKRDRKWVVALESLRMKPLNWGHYFDEFAFKKNHGVHIFQPKWMRHNLRSVFFFGRSPNWINNAKVIFLIPFTTRLQIPPKKYH